MENPVDNRLAELEKRVSALESAALSTPQEHAPPAALRASGGAEAGGVAVEGAVGQVAEAGPDWAGFAGTLAALGSPVRLRLLQEIVQGRNTVSALSEVDGLGTSGQIYHHLRQLTAEGWLHSPSRGTFSVPPPRVVALLAILEALQR
ncbi:ArsR/SmtB family transcription factor [Kribbella sp. NPDC051620]|uniref:ArsR/SmtB family transcription factor n=1 Tax=Kribbella sp. NPDC051620 TaxID=3364120 RepID=UPI00378DEC77